MALGNQYKVGVGSVGSYQISGVPWLQTIAVTNSAPGTQVDFKPDGTNHNVTRWIKVKNLHGSHTVKLGFSSAGVNSTGTSPQKQPWITLPANQADYIHLEVRVSSLFLLASNTGVSVEIIAGLTPIQDDFSSKIAAYRGIADTAL